MRSIGQFRWLRFAHSGNEGRGFVGSIRQFRSMRFALRCETGKYIIPASISLVKYFTKSRMIRSSEYRWV